MRPLLQLAFASLSAALIAPPVFSQVTALEEIVVTARKREENLQEVPVSISVISDSLIDEAGIVEPRDFFEMTPGVDFDTNGDRNNATPAVRGIQAKATATTRQKVMSFIDGLPLVGAQGTMQFTGIERVEVFRGPQSAAFGRSTFAGAINYVTRDPGEEFVGDLRLSTSDLGRNALQLELGGPINDTFGYTLDVNVDEYDGPDEWVSTEGFDVGGTSTEYISGKLSFAPTDRFDGEVRVMSMRTDDDMTLRYFIDPEEWARCTNLPSPNAMGVRWIDGTFDCDPSPPPGGIPTNIDTAAPFRGTPDELLASTYRIDPTVANTRDRIQGEFNFRHDAGDLQVLTFFSEETYLRWADGDRSDAPLNIVMGMVMGMSVNHMADPTDIEEKMVEVRWLSPDEERLRWTVGASFYDYDFLTLVWAQYGAIVDGIVDQFPPAQQPQPLVIISEMSENSAVFANLSYDLTERTTLSLEGRYQSEDMTNVNQVTGEAFTNTTTSFVPRLAINHSLDNGVTMYAQVSRGINPAGVIPAARSPRVERAHEQVFGLGWIEWDLDSVLFYAQEEIVNVEAGLKASLADNRVQLSSAIYAMDWEHYNQAYTLNWNVDTLARQRGEMSPGILPGLGPGDYRLRAQLDLGAANVQGLESEVAWFVDDNWEVRGSFTWQHTEYETFCDPDAVQQIGLTPTHTVANDPGVLFNCVDAVGNEFIRQPSIAYNASATYRGSVGNSGWDWVGRLDWRVVGEQWLDNVNLMALPETQTLNASLNFRNDNLDLRFWSRNLTDNNTPRIVQSAGSDYNQSPANQNFHVLPRDPREFGVSLNYSF